MQLLALCLLALLGAALSAGCPPCPAGTINTPRSREIVFAIIGDWGRAGGSLGFTPPSAGGNDYDGRCAAYFGKKAQEDVTGGQEQEATARALNLACKHAKCSFVVNTGDNFYECGIDNLMRFKTDWKDVYQGKDKPYIANLKWINSIGNHDIVHDMSVPAQIAYADKNWIFPERNFTYEAVSADKSLRLRFTVINTSPMVSSYVGNKQYAYAELNSTITPQRLSDQIRFLEQSLNSSTADYDLVVGHHPIFGTADTLYGTNVSTSDGFTDLGNPTAEGTGSFAEVLRLVRKYKPAAYLNGHDHVLALATDDTAPALNPTLYVTTGAGSLAEVADSCGYERPNVLYTSTLGGQPGADCQGDTAGQAFSGFVIATATAQTIKYDFYRLALESQGLPTAVETFGYVKAYTAVSVNWKKPAAAAAGAASCSC